MDEELEIVRLKREQIALEHKRDHLRETALKYSEMKLKYISKNPEKIRNAFKKFVKELDECIRK